MSILQAETAQPSDLDMMNETVKKGYVPFKVGAVVNGLPIWLEAEVPYSPDLEETLHIHETLKGVFREALKLLAEKLCPECSIPDKALRETR